MGRTSRFFSEEQERRIRHHKYFPSTVEESSPPMKCPMCNGEKYFAESQCHGSSIVNGICKVCGEEAIPSPCALCDGTGYVPMAEAEYYENMYKNDKR